METYVDANGKEIKAGTRVYCGPNCPRCLGCGTVYWNPTSNNDPQFTEDARCPDCYGSGVVEAAEYYGVILGISDPDGDVDDYGRTIGIAPRVTVLFDDGSDDRFIASWTAKGPWDEDAPYQCDDVTAIS